MQIFEKMMIDWKNEEETKKNIWSRNDSNQS